MADTEDTAEAKAKREACAERATALELEAVKLYEQGNAVEAVSRLLDAAQAWKDAEKPDNAQIVAKTIKRSNAALPAQIKAADTFLEGGTYRTPPTVRTGKK